MSERLARRARSARARPSSLRPRERATVIVVLVGVPLLVAFAAARILPDALWFNELGQLDVFTRIQVAKGELFVIAGGAAALLLGANFAIALSHVELPRTDAVGVAAAAVSLITASFRRRMPPACALRTGRRHGAHLEPIVLPASLRVIAGVVERYRWHARARVRSLRPRPKRSLT